MKKRQILVLGDNEAWGDLDQARACEILEKDVLNGPPSQEDYKKRSRLIERGKLRAAYLAGASVGAILDSLRWFLGAYPVEDHIEMHNARLLLVRATGADECGTPMTVADAEARVKDAKARSELARCDNCGRVFPVPDLVELASLEQRVDPGGPEPAGECPSCGALCYPFEEEV